MKNAASLSWWVSLIDVTLFPLFLLWFIWQLQFTAPWTWVVFPLWLAVSFAVHHDTSRTLGWRFDNLWPATKRALWVFALLGLALVTIGLVLTATRRPILPLFSPVRFAGYAVFCLIQQVALNSLIQNRLLSLVGRKGTASALSGLVFGSAHWPNPVLAPATLLLGSVMAWMFARERNILPLAIGQTVLGILAGWGFPGPWIHHLRVGPGYYTYHPY